MSDELKALPYIFNRIDNDLAYIIAILQIVIKRNKSDDIINSLVKKKSSLHINGDSDSIKISDELSQQLLDEKNKSFELDNGVTYCYRRFSKYVSESYDILSEFKMSKQFGELYAKLLTYFTSYSEAYRIHIIQQTSQVYSRRDSASSFLTFDENEFSATNTAIDLSKIDASYYLCYGIAGVVSDSYSSAGIYQPSVLLHYPSDLYLPEGVEMFCYPKKISLKLITTDQAKEILDADLVRHDEHVFTITNNEHLLYGCCRYVNCVVVDVFIIII